MVAVRRRQRRAGIIDAQFAVFGPTAAVVGQQVDAGDAGQIVKKGEDRPDIILAVVDPGDQREIALPAGAAARGAVP